MQAETDVQSHRDRADAAELEKNALKQQIAELREKLFKAQSDLDSVKTDMENMVPRCVLSYVFVSMNHQSILRYLFVQST
jgi:hypothetical protein